MKKEYLNEEKYQQVNNDIKRIGKLVTSISLIIGIILILSGIILLNNNKQDESINENLIEEKITLKEDEIKKEKNKLKNKLNQITLDLTNKKKDLINKGVKESSNYNDGEAYDLYILDNALDPDLVSHHCAFDKYNKNEMTKDYCTLNNLFNEDYHRYSCEDNEIIKDYCSLNAELQDLNNEKNFPAVIKKESFIHIPLIIIGVFIVFGSLIAKFMVFSITHRREIAAYTAQQMMPIAQEGAEKMAPTVGSVAKEITKGIKEVLKDEEK